MSAAKRAPGANKTLLLMAAVSMMTLCGGAGLAYHYLPERPASMPRDAEQLRLDLDRTSVRFHEALLHDIARRGEGFGESLEALSADRERANELAASLLEHAREERVDGPPTIAPDLRALGAPNMPAEDGRLLYVLALLEHDAESRSREIPDEILAFEVRSLGLGGPVAPEARPAAEAIRALAYARLGLCDLSQRAVQDSQLRGGNGGNASEHIEAPLAEALETLRPFVARGSLACCALVDGEHEDAATELRAALAAAEGLAIPPARRALLDAWAALLAGDPVTADTKLEGLEESDLPAADVQRLRALRDALARNGADGLEDALLRKADTRWLGSVVVETIRTELAEVPPSTAREAGRRLVAAESALMAAGRDREPLFDHGVKAGEAILR